MVQKDMLEHPESAESTTAGRKQGVIIAALSIAVVFILFIMIAAYARYGEEFVRRRDDSVGDMLMREGKRIEAGGVEARALETYERALKARFNGPENRTFTLERAGELHWRSGNVEKAAAYLSRALEGPGASLTPYEGLVDSLIRLNRLDEARQRLADWERVLEGVDDDGQAAKACYASGRMTEAEGDVEGAMEHYKHCVAQYDCAFSAARLGELYFDKDNQGNALRYLDTYFLLGAPRRDNIALHGLYSELLHRSDGQ